MGNPAGTTALRLEPGLGAARKEARWVQGVESEGCQVVLVARTCCSSSCPALVPPSAWPVLACGLTGSCLCLCISLDAATTDQNPLPSGVSLKEKWLLQPGGQSRQGGLRVPGRAPSRSWWPYVGSILLRLVCGHQWPSAISLLTLNSLSSKEASRAASPHLGSTVSFGSCVLPTGLRGVGAALPSPQDQVWRRSGS